MPTRPRRDGWPTEKVYDEWRYACRRAHAAGDRCKHCEQREELFGARAARRHWVTVGVPTNEALRRWRRVALRGRVAGFRGAREDALAAVESRLVAVMPELLLLARSGINGHRRVVGWVQESGRVPRQMVETVERWEYWLAGGAPGAAQMRVEPVEGCFEASLWRLWWRSGGLPNPGKPVLFWRLGRQMVGLVLPVLDGYREYLRGLWIPHWEGRRRWRLRQIEREIEAEEAAGEAVD